MELPHPATPPVHTAEPTAAQAVTTGMPHHLARERPRIVAIEDDPATAALYAAVLSAAGYEVTVLGSALGAAARVREVRPRAIVLDVALPYLSGRRFLRGLKADPATAGVPVVVVSALADLLRPHERATAAAVVAKPCAPAALVATLAGAIGAEPPPVLA